MRRKLIYYFKQFLPLLKTDLRCTVTKPIQNIPKKFFLIMKNCLRLRILWQKLGDKKLQNNLVGNYVLELLTGIQKRDKNFSGPYVST